jgi:hypothetical protein
MPLTHQGQAGFMNGVAAKGLICVIVSDRNPGDILDDLCTPDLLLFYSRCRTAGKGFECFTFPAPAPCCDASSIA